MPKKPKITPMHHIHLKTEQDMFGHKVFLVDPADNAPIKQVLLGQGLSQDELDLNGGRFSRCIDGEYEYRYRSFKFDVNSFDRLFETIQQTQGNWFGSFRAKSLEEDGKLTAYFKFELRSDASLFAFTHSDQFERFSPEMEQQEAQQEIEDAKPPKKLKVRKDGTVRVKVQVTSLG